MKYTLLWVLIFGLFSCKENKSKRPPNVNVVADTSTKVDTKKKAIINHRF